MEELLKSLIYIQQNLNAPKDQFNSFGKYKYRSLEGIQAAIKPLLAEQSCGIRFEDQVVEHCGRTFLRTTLYFFNDKGAVYLNYIRGRTRCNQERYGCFSDYRCCIIVCSQVCTQRNVLYR